jgi:hypothetical protein
LIDLSAQTLQALANDIREPKQLAKYSIESDDIPENVAEPNVPLITIPTSLSGGEVRKTPPRYLALTILVLRLGWWHRYRNESQASLLALRNGLKADNSRS